MNNIHILTPVKDSLDTTLKTIENIMGSNITDEYNYTVYNDFSSTQTSDRLASESAKQGFSLVNLDEITTHPSPNYLLVLQMAQKKAIADNAHLIIIESDIIIEKDTIQQLVDFRGILKKAGMIAAVTNDTDGNINFPYLYARNYETGVIETKKRLSFCCTLISNEFLNTFDFEGLNPTKSWHDISVSRKSVELGFKNYLLTLLPVTHLAHSSRPWKKIKYTNPLQYYWNKYTNNHHK